MGWEWKAILVLLATSCCSSTTEGSIGINWGRQSAQRLLPSQVVDLLLQNGIKRVRLYSSEADVVSAFAGSGIEISVSMFRATQINSTDTATAYVDKRMPFFAPCNIRNIYTGGYVFDVGNNQSYMDDSMQSLRFLQAALNERKFPDGRPVGSQVKASFLIHELALKLNVTKPSDAEFCDEFKPTMIEYLRFLREHDAPFNLEMLSIINAVEIHNFGINFSFADNKSGLAIADDATGAVYTNIFEWTYDSFVWALKKLNFSDVRIVVTQAGWPTDGYPEANIANAERFFKYLLPLVASDKGTPMRPGAPIDVNVHALTDETKMTGPAFTRHWGIYRSNGQPKYKIDLSGQGRDVYPTTAKGIMRMPQRWCVFTGDRGDMMKVQEMTRFACANTDCSSSFAGGSCSGLSYDQNVSFVFNMFFQFQFQEEEACDFGGLGTISVENPSMGSCIFPVEVVKGRQRNFVPRPPKGFVFNA